MRCDAAVAEKEEATDAPGEKFEYQAEVRFVSIHQMFRLSAFGQNFNLFVTSFGILTCN